MRACHYRRCLLITAWRPSRVGTKHLSTSLTSLIATFSRFYQSAVTYSPSDTGTLVLKSLQIDRVLSLLYSHNAAGRSARISAVGVSAIVLFRCLLTPTQRSVDSVSVFYQYIHFGNPKPCDGARRQHKNQPLRGCWSMLFISSG